MAGLQRGGAITSSKAPTAPMINPNNSRPVQVAVALSPGCIGLILRHDASHLVWQSSAWSQVAGLPTAIIIMAITRSVRVLGATSPYPSHTSKIGKGADIVTEGHSAHTSLAKSGSCTDQPYHSPECLNAARLLTWGLSRKWRTLKADPTYSGHGGHGKVNSCNILVDLGCLPQIIATCRHIIAIDAGQKIIMSAVALSLLGLGRWLVPYSFCAACMPARQEDTGPTVQQGRACRRCMQCALLCRKLLWAHPRFPASSGRPACTL